MPNSKTTEPLITLLEPPQIAEAIHQHFRDQPARGNQLWSEMRGNDKLHLMALCRSPSVLTVVCDLFDANGSLPSNRGALFAHLVNALLSREEIKCRETGAAWLGYDAIKRALAGLAYEIKARLVIPYQEAQALLSPHTAKPDQLIKAAASASLLLVEETVRFIDPAVKAFFTSEKLGEMMDSGRPAVEFLPLDNWQVHRVWEEALLMLAGNRDPVRVARWIAEANPLMAYRCLTDSGHNLNVKEIDVAILDLNEIAYRWFRTNNESGTGVGRNVDPMPGLASVIAKTANPKHPASMSHLTYVLEQYVPVELLPATFDWLRVIDDKDLPGFFVSLLRSRDSLQTYGKQLADLSLDHREKPLILHMDDEKGALTLIQIMITRGFREQVLVVSVEDSAAALILANALIPDLVLTDTMVPGMPGFTFVGYLKQNPLTQNVPFVFLTAQADVEAVTRGIELGAKKYLSVPILFKDLLTALQEVMGIEA